MLQRLKLLWATIRGVFLTAKRESDERKQKADK
jgi:hypothetical protein